MKMCVRIWGVFKALSMEVNRDKAFYMSFKHLANLSFCAQSCFNMTCRFFAVLIENKV